MSELKYNDVNKLVSLISPSKDNSYDTVVSVTETEELEDRLRKLLEQSNNQSGGAHLLLVIRKKPFKKKTTKKKN